MHWITTLGILLIAAGTILTCFGQNIMNRFDNKHILRSISEKTFRIDELTSSNNELFTRINEYQKRLLEKDETIHGLEVQVGGSNISVKKQSIDKQIEVGAQTILGKHLSDEIAQAKRLYNEGKYDEAYRIADEQRENNSDFGLARFILGTIEMHRKHYDKGEEMLKKAIQFGLPDEDMAWAFHNLGYSSLRKQDFEKAREFLGKAIELNSDMENSRKALKLVDDHLHKKQATAQVKSYFNEGRYDDAYLIAGDLKQKNPEFGLAYSIIGTIELYREHYDKGEEMLKKAVQLGLPDEDKAWAFHNLGVSSLRKKDYETARELLEKAVGLSPNMEESQKTLDSIDDLQRKEKQEKD
ncbi:MAG: tetratricopeptide repeat protein [Candidatus Scalindua sp.]|nr:tetratricopeptide repeat protein [Candidatus Scalindua sp.]MCR4343910.1 tetratricopeptide repeat protein [Candidatus Scalindua sp.]